MVLNGIFGALAALSLVLVLWQWLAAHRFPLHQRRGQSTPASRTQAAAPAAAPRPGVTLLKPLKGADAHTEKCLRSWLQQDYEGPVQALFGVADASDPACAIVQRLVAEHPHASAQLVVCGALAGANAKVSKLIHLEQRAQHELICVSDADVCVPPDFLTDAVAAFDSASAPDKPMALLNCFYRLANPATLAMHCEAVAINADFWSQVLQSVSLKPMDFALGAVMLTRRSEVADMGGFAAIKDCLADDYQLGHRIAQRGGRIALSPVVVECWDAPAGWAAVWKHQLRWARTIRVCQPVPYFFSLLSNPTLWPALWAAVSGTRTALGFLGAALLVRLVVAADLQQRLAGDRPDSDIAAERPPIVRYCWLAPVKDVLQVGVWLLAFLGNTIEWRGRRMKLRRDGTLIPA